VSFVSVEALEAWFLKHQELAWEIKRACMPIRASATAQWKQTAEGRVCEAALVAGVFNTHPEKGDEYQPHFP
jgi:hypothetical protein